MEGPEVMPMVSSAVLAEIAGPDLLIVVAVVVLLFGSAKLPQLARSLGQASHEFRKGASEGGGDGDDAPPASKETVTMTKAELDALIAEREAQARGRPRSD